MFDTKERATLAANIAGTMAAGKGWHLSSKDLVRLAEEILIEIDLMYKPKAVEEEMDFYAESRRLSSQNPFVI